LAEWAVNGWTQSAKVHIFRHFLSQPPLEKGLFLVFLAWSRPSSPTFHFLVNLYWVRELSSSRAAEWPHYELILRISIFPYIRCTYHGLYTVIQYIYGIIPYTEMFWPTLQLSHYWRCRLCTSLPYSISWLQAAVIGFFGLILFGLYIFMSPSQDSQGRR